MCNNPMCIKFSNTFIEKDNLIGYIKNTIFLIRKEKQFTIFTYNLIRFIFFIIFGSHHSTQKLFLADSGEHMGLNLG